MFTTIVRRILRVLSFAIVVCLSQASGAADKKAKPFISEPVSAKQSIRFYKANKQLQADRVMITADKASNLGCNNFLKKVRVFKTLQIGFKSCSLYLNKDCDVASLVPVTAEKQKRHSYILTEGQAWFVQGEDQRGADVRSWSCGMQLEHGELRLETLLAEKESIRLNRARALAGEKLDKAQANFDQAKKDLNESRGYQKRVLDEAIAAGAIEVQEDPKVEAEAPNAEGLDESKDG